MPKGIDQPECFRLLSIDSIRPTSCKLMLTSLLPQAEYGGLIHRSLVERSGSIGGSGTMEL